MNISIKTSAYINKNGLSNIYFDLADTKYRKKIKSDLYVRFNNYTYNKISEIEPNHISKKILLEKIKKQRSLALNNYNLGKWKISDCEKYLKKGVEIQSIKDFVNNNFNSVSMFTKNDYLNTIGVYKKHLEIDRTLYLKDLNKENLLLFKTNTLYSGVKISSINSYLKKLKVIVNKAHLKNMIIDKNIFTNNLIEKTDKKEIEEKIINLNDIEKGIFNAENIYELQAIAFFITMIIFKGMTPIEMVKYKRMNISDMTNPKDGYISYTSKGIKKIVKFNENIFKLIRAIKVSLYYTHFKKNPEMLAPYNNEYEIFNIGISKDIKKHKNLWNIYQKKIKKLIGCSFRMTNTIYINFINDLEISYKARQILIGCKNDDDNIFNLKEPIRTQINSAEDKMQIKFQLGKLIALIENKMNLLGIINIETRNKKWQRPIDFIKNISEL